jgi:hypothetical protein
MRALPLSLLATALLGCPGDPIFGDKDDTDGPDSGDTTAEGVPIPSGERILLFHGAGGPDPDEDGWGRFDVADARWKDAYDWNADYRDAIPEDLSDYRAIFFLSPGYTGEASFDPADLDRLSNALAAGTRMIVTAEREHCGEAALTELLEGLGTTLRFSGDGQGAYQIAEVEEVSPHQATAGVSTLRFRDPCWVDMGEGDRLVRYREDLIVAVEQVGRGGEVFVIGDFEFMADGDAGGWADNALFSDRLVEIDPAMAE